MFIHFWDAVTKPFNIGEVYKHKPSDWEGDLQDNTEWVVVGINRKEQNIRILCRKYCKYDFTNKNIIAAETTSDYYTITPSEYAFRKFRELFQITEDNFLEIEALLETN